ncbi:MAG: iron ABC transporter permease [Acidobacteria bacterium]|nr:iron ABC transporter permease [Acidobacteriota bacterium]
MDLTVGVGDGRLMAGSPPNNDSTRRADHRQTADLTNGTIRRTPRRWGWLLTALVPAIFIGYFFVYPVARILTLGLSELSFGSSGLEARLIRVGWFTVWQATASTVLTLLFAAPMTWAVSRFEFRGRRLATALVTVPFVLPTVVVGTAFVALGWRDSIWAILAAHVFFNTAIIVRTVGTLWARLDPDILGAARVLGAGPWETFRRVTLPLLKPAIAAATSIVFLFTFTSFGVVLIIGGFEYATLEVEIYRQAVSFFDLPLAAALALVQLVGVTAALYGYSRYQDRHTSSWALSSDSSRVKPRGGARAGVVLAVGGTLSLLAIPIGVLVARSLGTDSYRALFQDDAVVGVPIESAANSFRFAAVAMVIAVVIGVMSAAVIAGRSGRLSRWFDLTLMLPLGTSAVTIGFGFIVALGWPVDLRASFVLVPIAHALIAVPFVVRITVPTLKAIPPDLHEAAAVLGTSRGRVWWRIDFPIVAKAALVGSAFAFVISLGEFGATSFVARPATITMPVMIFRLLSRPGQQSLGMAMALAVALAAITAAVVMWIDRLQVGEVGSF